MRCTRGHIQQRRRNTRARIDIVWLAGVGPRHFTLTHYVPFTHSLASYLLGFTERLQSPYASVCEGDSARLSMKRPRGMNGSIKGEWWKWCDETELTQWFVGHIRCVVRTDSENKPTTQLCWAAVCAFRYEKVQACLWGSVSEACVSTAKWLQCCCLLCWVRACSMLERVRTTKLVTPLIVYLRAAIFTSATIHHTW